MQLSSNRLVASEVIQYIMTGIIALLQSSSLDKVQEVIVMTNVDVDGRCYLRERVADRLCKTNGSTSCYSKKQNYPTFPRFEPH